MVSKIALHDVRPSVANFARWMEKVLREHDEKRGWDGWKVTNRDDLPQMMTFLIRRAHEELEEVEETLFDPKIEVFDYFEEDAESVMRECADVGNIMMMVFDNVFADYLVKRAKEMEG